VLLGSILPVLIRVKLVTVRQMCMMGRLLMVPGFVVRGSFMVVVGCLLVMSGCLLVVMACFLRHWIILSLTKQYEDYPSQQRPRDYRIFNCQ
jgi:hypothetical protein